MISLHNTKALLAALAAFCQIPKGDDNGTGTKSCYCGAIGMKQLLLSLISGVCLAGCGLAGTAAGTAAGSAAEVEQARQAKQIEEQARQQAQDAVAQDAARRAQAEKDAQ